MERIIVIVSPTGEATIKPTGMKGTRCKDVTRDLEKALGTTTNDVKTGDYYTQEQGQGAGVSIGSGQ